MDWLQALVLGIVQGLTEYLPVSSSGHLTIGQELLGVTSDDNLMFDIVVHVATVCSTLVVLWKEVAWLLKGLWQQFFGHQPAEVPAANSHAEPHALHASNATPRTLNPETRYFINILISMIPVGIVGVFFKDYVEQIFGSGLLIVGIMLLLTATLLIFSYYARPRQKEHISLRDAFLIGVAQACAVMPGLSRSGSTIATGLLLGNRKETLAQFSFLMVIPPILGEALLDAIKALQGEDVVGSIGTVPLLVGFVAAFLSGCVACKWMINIVKRGKLIWFGVYCAIVGAIVIACSL